MALKITAILAFIFSSAVCLWAAPALPPAAQTPVCSAIVYDLDHDAILFEQNADERIPPASLTKVMSMFLALDHVNSGKASFDDMVKISPLAAGTGGSRMGLRPNEEVSLQKLLMGMAVSSGNDASHAVAEHVGGSAEAFVKMMNTRCKQLGMEDSQFFNPHGMPAEGQYTTARDMLTLARAYLREHPYALAMHNTRVLEHGGIKTWNKNPLLGQYPGADGLKSGWIRASGYNLIFTANRDGRRLLAVILGAPDKYVRGAEACRLLDAGFMVCNNQAVTVAAALDMIATDLNRIDPRKTAKDFGIQKPRLLAKASPVVKKGKRLTLADKRLSGKKAKLLAVKKAKQKDSKLMAAKKAHSVAKNNKPGAAKKSAVKSVRAQTVKVKSHAAKRSSRSIHG